MSQRDTGRRSTQAEREDPSLAKLVITAALAIAMCSVLATALALLDSAAISRIDEVVQVAGVLASAMFVGAGVLRISRWRIAKDERSLLMGTALVVLGGVAIPFTNLAGALMRADPDSFLRASTAILTTLVVLGLVETALVVPVGILIRPTRLIFATCGTATLGFVLLALLHFGAPQFLRSELADPPVVRGSVLALAWFGVAVHAAVCGNERQWAGQVAPLLACMGVGEVLHTLAVYPYQTWELIGALLVATVALITATRALNDLDEATTAGQDELRETAEELTQTRCRVDAQHAWREELTHDARNALAGLRAALQTLERYEGKLDPTALERLRAAAIGELGHLEHLIIRAAQDEPVDFDVMSAIKDAVETRRAAGLEVEVHEFSCLAHGRPGDLVTVVQNLLVNADQHGRGRKVRLCVVEASNRVELYVSDRGPGLSDAHAARLFERGARGEGSNGSGLGLFVSRTLMREQGGDLELRGHKGGAVFVVTLKPAKPSPLHIPRQRLALPQPVGASR